jgi:hypothetical protein
MKGATSSGAKTFCRCYGTFLAAVLACVGAETWAVAGVMVAFGAVFDMCRSFIAPDLTMGEPALAESIVSAVNDPAIAGRYRTAAQRWAWAIYGVWAGYTVVFSLAQPMLNPDAARAYLAFFEPVYRLCGMAFAVARSHPRELLARGYDDRALVVAHIYSFNWIMFVISLGSNLLVRANERAHPVKLTSDVAALLRGGRWQDAVGRPVLCLAMALFFYVLVSHGLKIAWKHQGTRAWAVQDDNVPFPLLTCALFSAEWMFSWAYSYAIWYRTGATLRRAGQSPRLTAAPV